MGGCTPPIMFRCRLLYPFSSEFPDNRETNFLTCHFYQLRCINEGSSKLCVFPLLDKAYNETKIRATGICRDSDKIVTTASKGRAHAQPAALPLIWSALVNLFYPILSYVIDIFLRLFYKIQVNIIIVRARPGFNQITARR